MFIAILGFCAIHYFLYEGDDEESDRVRDATKSGLIALLLFIIYLDLKAAPFFIVWLTHIIYKLHKLNIFFSKNFNGKYFNKKK